MLISILILKITLALTGPDFQSLTTMTHKPLNNNECFQTEFPKYPTKTSHIEKVKTYEAIPTGSYSHLPLI